MILQRYYVQLNDKTCYYLKHMGVCTLGQKEIKNWIVFKFEFRDVLQVRLFFYYHVVWQLPFVDSPCKNEKQVKIWNAKTNYDRVEKMFSYGIYGQKLVHWRRKTGCTFWL